MAPPKGHPKWGGRKEGTPNNITIWMDKLDKTVAVRLAEEEYDPIAKMKARVEVAEELAEEFPKKAYLYMQICNKIDTELLQYVDSKKKSVELIRRDPEELAHAAPLFIRQVLVTDAEVVKEKDGEGVQTQPTTDADI